MKCLPRIVACSILLNWSCLSCETSTNQPISFIYVSNNSLKCRNGSVVADFTIHLLSLESYQLVYLQDSIQNQGAIGKKIIVIGAPSSFNSSQGL